MSSASRSDKSHLRLISNNSGVTVSRRGEVWSQQGKTRFQHSGLEAVTEPSLDRIIEQLHSCIGTAKALQLEMLEHILSIALLQAHEDKDEAEDDSCD
jgi:hypothetical protein